MEKISIERMRREQIAEAVELLAKAFATQPSALAIYGAKPDIAVRMGYVFGAMLYNLPGQVLVGKQGDRVVAVMRMVEWPHCQPSALQRLKMLPGLRKGGGGPVAFKRALEFRGTWAKADVKKPHWHLDPLGVAPDLQGQGVGSQMMEYYCAHLDRLGMAAYHETDRKENVPFYERFGFKVIGQQQILGFPNWYLWREPRSIA